MIGRLIEVVLGVKQFNTILRINLEFYLLIDYFCRCNYFSNAVNKITIRQEEHSLPTSLYIVFNGCL